VWLVAMTGHGTESDRREALVAGFNAHVTKPVDMDQLDRILETSPRGSSRVNSPSTPIAAPDDRKVDGVPTRPPSAA